MQGLAYLRSSESTLPDLVFSLRGQGFEIEIPGAIDSVKGGLRGTFTALPDAPVSKFVLSMPGGKKGLIQNSANLCFRPQLARARMLGHARRGWIQHPRLSIRCRKGANPKSGGKK